MRQSVCKYLQQEQNFGSEFFGPAHKDATNMQKLENKAIQIQTRNTAHVFLQYGINHRNKLAVIAMDSLSLP